MELRQSRPLLLHRRTASNLALPPYGAILRPLNKYAFPLNLHNAYQIAIFFVLEDT